MCLDRQTSLLLSFSSVLQGMDRRVFGERRAGHSDEQLAHHWRKIVVGRHGPDAMRRVSAGRSQVPDRSALHIHPSGVFVVLGFGYVFIFFILLQIQNTYMIYFRSL